MEKRRWRETFLVASRVGERRMEVNWILMFGKQVVESDWLNCLLTEICGKSRFVGQWT